MAVLVQCGPCLLGRQLLPDPLWACSFHFLISSFKNAFVFGVFHFLPLAHLFSLIFYFFLGVADFLVPGFSIFSVSHWMFNFSLNLIVQIFSLTAHSLFMMYWFWVSVWRTFVALICILTALLLQNRADLLV